MYASECSLRARKNSWGFFRRFSSHDLFLYYVHIYNGDNRVLMNSLPPHLERSMGKLRRQEAMIGSVILLLLAMVLFSLFSALENPLTASSGAVEFSNKDLEPEENSPETAAKQTESIAETKPASKYVVVTLEEGIQAPFLWKVTGAGLEKPSYLFGTIHIPDTRVTTLHPEVQKAFDSADAVYTEIPMDIMNPANLMGQLGLVSKIMLPWDQKVTDHLDAETEKRIEAILSDYHYSLAMFQQMKVWVIAAQLGQLDLIEEISSGKELLDQKIFNDAKRLGKEAGALETPESQIAVFDDLPVEEQVEFLKQTLDAIEKAKAKGLKPSAGVVDAYLSGDTKNIVGMLSEHMDLDDPLGYKMYDRLLLSRDADMAKKMAEMMTANPGRTYFFAIGALHLPRELGVVGLLRSKGFTVERVGVNEEAK